LGTNHYLPEPLLIAGTLLIAVGLYLFKGQEIPRRARGRGIGGPSSFLFPSGRRNQGNPVLKNRHVRIGEVGEESGDFSLASRRRLQLRLQVMRLNKLTVPL
jgi:hypothetical protein